MSRVLDFLRVFIHFVAFAKASHACQIQAENCTCIENEQDTQMNCLKNELAYSIDLDFDQLKSKYLNKSIKLEIKNKFINEIKASLAENAFTRKVTSLRIENCKIKELKANSFESMLSLRELFLNNDEIENIHPNSFAGLNSSLISLELISNRLKIITKEVFQNLQNLQYLNLNINEIEEMETDSFSSLNSLKGIKLEGNRLKSLRYGSFKNLTRLEIFHMRENEISIIEMNFSDISLSLKQIDLAKNSIMLISPFVFKYLNQLEILNLHENQINKIEIDTFNYLTSLKQLYLYGNKIETIQDGLFTNVTLLEQLWLFDNQITSIDAHSFDSLKNLQMLLLHKNKLKSLQNDLFKNLISLKLYLALNDNQITTIELNSFDTLKSLTNLYLYSNKMKIIKNGLFVNLTSLKYLWLDRNLIEKIEPTSFDSLLGLVELRLNNNKLVEVRYSLLKNLKNLDSLYLDKNAIETIEENSFESLTIMKVLSLSSNKIKKIQSGLFANLTNLEVLWLEDNEIMNIEENSLFYLRNLKEVSLFSNKNFHVKKLTLTQINLLRYFNISYNNLIKIEYKSFWNLPFNMEYIDLSFNYLDGYNELGFEGVDFNGSLFINFNFIKKLSKHLFANGLYSLQDLYLKNNGLTLIEDYSLASLFNLKILYLDSNSIQDLSGNSFNNLTSLELLSLSYNSIKGIFSIRSSLKHLVNLKSIVLSNNFIEYIRDDDFTVSPNIQSIDLNSNLIKSIQENSLNFLSTLKSFKISNNHLSKFEMKSLNWKNVLETDLSFNTLDFEGFNDTSGFSQNLNFLKIQNVSILNFEKFSFEIFLNSKIKIIDFSNNRIENFKIFNNLQNLISLELRRVNLESMSQIEFGNFKDLKYLDLSHNRLSQLTFTSFEFLLKLEYLDLGSNQIAFIDSNIFNRYEISVPNRLRHLNLENNLIVALESIFINYLNLELFKISNNFLNDMPYFGFYIIGNWLQPNPQLDFSHNNLKKIREFPVCLGDIYELYLDFNKISLIELNALFRLKSLKNLSMSNNLLENITENNFFYLTSLKYLNLSFNRLKSIEMNSFVNLNKLISLDLSHNDLHSIEANLFNGLDYLNDFFLFNQSEAFNLNNKSFESLTSVGNIYLNKATLIEYKCIFVRFAKERNFLRNIRNKFKFYKSINLITHDMGEFFDCDLIFNFLQFRIHFNLRTDYENELFYEKCKISLIKASNTFDTSQMKCSEQSMALSEFIRHDNENLLEEENKNRLGKVFNDFIYYLTMGLILSLLGPAFCMICNHFYIFEFKRVTVASNFDSSINDSKNDNNLNEPNENIEFKYSAKSSQDIEDDNPSIKSDLIIINETVESNESEKQ
jgi:Leucine-rich repeat (LRR) protein